METENLHSEVEEKKQKKQKEFSVKHILDGSWFTDKMNHNRGYFLLVIVIVIFYIANGYSMEKLYRKKSALETELKELRFESMTRSADLMFIRKQSEVIRRIREEGLDLESSKEPPIKLYR
jgi:hypothetical protein